MVLAMAAAEAAEEAMGTVVVVMAKVEAAKDVAAMAACADSMSLAAGPVGACQMMYLGMAVHSQAQTHSRGISGRVRLDRRHRRRQVAAGRATVVAVMVVAMEMVAVAMVTVVEVMVMCTLL